MAIETTAPTPDAAIPAPADEYDSAWFKADTAKHVMTVLHDDGLYRHLRFVSPGTGFYHFDLVTWPGYLSFSGDMRAHTFARLRDMFEFFRAKSGWNGDTINPQYWAEKLQTDRDCAKAYSMEKFLDCVNDRVNDAIKWNPHFGDATDDQPGLADAVKLALTDEYNHEYEDGAREFLRDFEYHVEGHDPFQFVDTWEWDLRDWDSSYLWACHAIQWGIDRYDAWVAAGRRAPEPVPQKVSTVELPGGAS